MAAGVKESYERLGETLDSIPFIRAHGLLIFMVALGALFDAVEQYNVGYVAPILTELWGINETQVGLLATFTFGGLAVGSLITGAAVTVALVGATVMPLIAGAIFGAGGVFALFAMVAVMYLVMAVTVFVLNVETKGRSLEELSEFGGVAQAASA